MERLEMSGRLAALGKLAARVAHELNNPLDGILRYINLALRLLQDTPESRLTAYLSESRTGLMRMAQIIGDLLEYTRTTEGMCEAMNVNQVVEEALRSCQAAAEAAGVVTTVDFQAREMPGVTGSRLYQVCTNLIKNAIDAMPQGGRLTITTGIVHDEVVIRVADTGVGLPQPAERIFEPFFTTKPPGKGTGLGLTICKDFVESMEGSLAAATGEGGGAVFTVRIPVGSFRRRAVAAGSSPSVCPSSGAPVRRGSGSPSGPGTA
jgi:signal transduction histidine kinase